MSRRLDAASRLIDGLSSERARWTNDMNTLEAKIVQLVGDCLLTASFLSYTGLQDCIRIFANHNINNVIIPLK